MIPCAGLRQYPAIVQEFREINFAPPSQSMPPAYSDNQLIVKKRFELQFIIVGKRPHQPYHAEIVLPIAQTRQIVGRSGPIVDVHDNAGVSR